MSPLALSCVVLPDQPPAELLARLRDVEQTGGTQPKGRRAHRGGHDPRSPGVDLGVGTRARDFDAGVLGQPKLAVRERADRFEERLGVLVAALPGGVTQHSDCS